MESSVCFGSTDDCFAHRLARELDAVVKTPPENFAHRVCRSDMGHIDYFSSMPTSSVPLFISHSEPPAASARTRRMSKRLSNPGEQPGLLRRLSSWKPRSTLDASRISAASSTASINSQNIGASPVGEHAYPYPQRPRSSVRLPPRSDISHGLHSDSSSSWASASASGHGCGSSTHAHSNVGFCDTPATSATALSIPPLPPLPAELEDALTQLWNQQHEKLDFVSSSSSSSEEQLQTPPEGEPRPSLPRVISSRRWGMPTPTGRATLCTQEIVETEENYRRALRQLLRGETTFPPPSKLTALVPALLASSPCFATSPRMPGSATANAFIEAAPALEKALVKWCAVVGRFFHPRSRSSFTSDLSSLRSVSMRNLNVLRPRVMVGQRLGVDSRGDLVRVEIGVGGGKRAKKVPTVQDLAIQPTQRAVRYVLLFRELLEHVNGKEREDVQRALDAALRIARRCDEALELVVAHPQRT